MERKREEARTAALVVPSLSEIRFLRASRKSRDSVKYSLSWELGDTKVRRLAVPARVWKRGIAQVLRKEARERETRSTTTDDERRRDVSFVKDDDNIGVWAACEHELPLGLRSRDTSTDLFPNIIVRQRHTYERGVFVSLATDQKAMSDVRRPRGPGKGLPSPISLKFRMVSSSTFWLFPTHCSWV